MKLQMSPKALRTDRKKTGWENGVALGGPKPGSSFVGALRDAGRQKGVTFSKHATARLNDWGKPLGEDMLSGLQSAVEAASAKGARATLVLMKGVAFVVAPQKRTVVTVIPDERIKENIFTSIDSAVVLDL